jgi:hypothetical protein
MERVDRLTNHTPRSPIATVPLAVSIRSQNLRRTPGLPHMRGCIPLGKKSKRDDDPAGHVSVDGDPTTEVMDGGLDEFERAPVFRDTGAIEQYAHALFSPNGRRLSGLGWLTALIEEPDEEGFACVFAFGLGADDQASAWIQRIHGVLQQTKERNPELWCPCRQGWHRSQVGQQLDGYPPGAKFHKPCGSGDLDTIPHQLIGVDHNAPLPALSAHQILDVTH